MAKKATVGKVKVTHQVIHKGHQFVESAQHLLLLNKHKNFENDASARFCCINEQSKKWRKKHGNQTNNKIESFCSFTHLRRLRSQPNL